MKYFVVVTAFLILGSCQKKNSDIQATEAPKDQQQQGDPTPPPTPPPPLPPTPPPEPPPTSQYPIAELEYSEYIWTNPNDDLHIHVILNAPSTDVITMDVSLVDATALFGRDYTGFASGSAQTQTIVFPPGERIYHLPSVLVSDSPTCRSKFLVKLSTSTGANVRLGPDAEVFLNCP